MKKIDNYKEYDKLHIYVKEGLVSNIIEYYKLLGWQFENKKENQRYEDIVDMSFYRPHNIENKDELQLMQVYMEEKLNALGKIKKRKHTLSTTLGLSSGILGLSMIVLGLLNVFNVFWFLGFIFGLIFSIAGGVLCISNSITLPKIIKKEKEKYQIQFDKINKELEEICQKAKTLTGVKDERK